MLEFGSKNSRELSAITLEKLKIVLPVLSMAANRFREEERNRIEAVIQKECTTIHSSVKWKFVESAKEYILKQDLGQKPVFTDLSFEEVFPLYGQLDIKGSSTKRNEAVLLDLSLQLNHVAKIINTALW